MMKIMKNLKVEYYMESLSTHDHVAWRNIETDPLRRDKGQDTYREEMFQLLLRNLYFTNKQKLLDFAAVLPPVATFAGAILKIIGLFA